MKTPVTLPNQGRLLVDEATRLLAGYWEESRHVFDLFDAENVKRGDRDAFEPLDFLSLGVLNARLSSADLQNLWLADARGKAESLLAKVPRGRVESLSDTEIDRAAITLAEVAGVLGSVPGWGFTRVGKLLHRMRPGLAPIYDTLVATFYDDSSFSEWGPWYRTVMKQVRASAEALQSAIDNTPAPFNAVSAVRAWDILLWTLAKQRGAP